MIRSLLGLCLRQFLAAVVGLGIVLVFSAVLLTVPEHFVATLPVVLRMGVMGSVAVLLLIEVPRLREHLRVRDALLKRERRTRPQRPERILERRSTTLVLVVVLIAGFVARKMWTGRPETTVVEVLFVLLAARSTLWLLAGSWTRVRLWSRTWRIPGADDVPGAFPLLVGAQAATGIALVVFRLPHVAISNVLFVFTVAALQGLLDGSGSGEVEFLVQLGPDDHAFEITDTLNEYVAHQQPAAPSAARHESVDASQTLLVSVPAITSPFLWVALESDDENVERIELNGFVQPVRDTKEAPCDSSLTSGPSSDPLSAGQTALRFIRADRVLRRSIARLVVFPAKLAVIDTGVDAAHEDLRGVVIGRSGDDRRGHGTAIAGIAAAIGNNGVGMASLNDQGRFVKVLDYPALSGHAPAADDVAEALFKAVDDGADVVVMAFSARGVAPSLMVEAVQHAAERDVVLVAAAGNNGPGGRASDRWPANMDGVLVVAGLDGTRLAHFSNRAGPTSIAAPATAVCAPTPGGGYQEQTGTSMAAALVAGAISRRRAQCPNESARWVVGLLSASSARDPLADVPALRVDALLDADCSPR